MADEGASSSPEYAKKNDGETKQAPPLPHYALPNFSVVLPTYSNHESDVISQAFRIGNYMSIHDLPSRIKPGQVSRGRFQKILDNRQPAEDLGEAGRFVSKPKLFSEFEYMPSPYSIADVIHRDERREDQRVMERVGHTAPFMMSDTAVKHKYEDFGGGKSTDYRGEPDPYERADDQSLRHRWLEDAQILAGPFKPSMRVRGQLNEAATERPSPKMMPEIIEQLRFHIEEDWSEYAFLVCATDDEHVVIRFELSTLDSEPGLVAYMNVFARTNHVVGKFLLRKVVEDWNVTPGDGHLYFTFRPPWVTTRVADTYFSLHPEARAYQDPRLARERRMAEARAAEDETPAPQLGSEEPPAAGLSDFESSETGVVQRPELT